MRAPTDGLVADLRARVRRVRALLLILVRRDIRTRYRTSVLDLAWAVITPVTLLAVYGVILTGSFNVTSPCAPYLTSAWSGLVVWTAFSTAVGGGVYSLVGSSELITKVYFPPEAMPLAQVGVSFVDLGVGAVTLAAIALAQGVVFTPAALWVLLPLAVLVVWSAVVAVFVAVLAVFVRDAIHAVNLFIRVGFFATPVMYESSFLPESFRWTATANPIAAAIDGVRASLLCGVPPSRALLALHLGIGLVGLVLVVLYIRSVESRIVDVV